jgi:serine/threonine protein kinase
MSHYQLIYQTLVRFFGIFFLKYIPFVIGTPTYMAPEVLNEFQSYSFPADIWSFGALISFMCNGTHLFWSHDSVFEWRLTDPLPGMFSRELKDLVTQMLNPNPKFRPSADYVWNETVKDDRQRNDL